MKFEIKSKQLVFATVGILVIKAAIFGYKVYSENHYLKKTQELKNDIIIITGLSEKVTSEYSDIWRKQIQAVGRSEINVNGRNMYFSDAEDALKYAKGEMEIAGFIFAIDSLSTVITEIMRSITPPPSKYKEFHTTITSLYSDCTHYSSLALSPDGSYMSFNIKKSELSSSISNKVAEISLALPLKDNLHEIFLEVNQSVINQQRLYYEKSSKK